MDMHEESIIEYPCDFPIKIMGKAEQDFARVALGIVKHHAPDFDEATMEIRASKGGNYLLNVGPTAEGVIPAPSVDRLEAMGAWLAVNGESIYGTTAGPLQGLDWCRTTARPGTVYLHVFDWPADGLLDIDLTHVARAYLLADDGQAALPVAGQGTRTQVRAPHTAPDPIDTVVVLELE